MSQKMKIKTTVELNLPGYRYKFVTGDVPITIWGLLTALELSAHESKDPEIQNHFLAHLGQTDFHTQNKELRIGQNYFFGPVSIFVQRIDYVPAHYFRTISSTP